MAGGIFINYRRALNLKDAQLLRNGLQRHFRQRGVFLDVSGLDGGDHWLHTLEKQVDASAAMVVLIGRGWADVTDEKGNRRLDNPNDFVRFELARAFSRSMPVLPVLVDGAEVPDVAQLPTNLLPLTFPQAMLLRSQSLNDDADRIARRLRCLIAQSRRRGVLYLTAGTGAAVALALGIAVGPMLLSRLGLPLPGVVLPGDARLRADLDAARGDLAKAARERDVLRAGLAASRKEVDTAKTAAAQSAAALRAATKARDDALAKAKTAKADADDAQKRAADAQQAREAIERTLKEAREQLAKKQAFESQPMKQLKDLKGELAAVEAQTRAEAKRKEKVSKRAGQVFRDCPDVCPEMVVLRAGEFTMGSNRYDSERPPHKVVIQRPFAVGKFEVTFAEWDACVAEGGCTHRPGDEDWGRGRQPVINVSWNDAK